MEAVLSNVCAGLAGLATGILQEASYTKRAFHQCCGYTGSHNQYAAIGDEETLSNGLDSDEEDERRLADEQEVFNQLPSDSKAAKVLGLQLNDKARKILGQTAPARKEEMKVTGSDSE